MKNISLAIISLVIFTGTSFSQQTQGTGEKKKTEKKAMTNKHVKKQDKKDCGAKQEGK
jgi:hypothetical protein